MAEAASIINFGDGYATLSKKMTLDSDLWHTVHTQDLCHFITMKVKYGPVNGLHLSLKESLHSECVSRYV